MRINSSSAVLLASLLLAHVIADAAAQAVPVVPLAGVPALVPADGSGSSYVLGSSPWEVAAPASGYQPGAPIIDDVFNVSAPGNGTVGISGVVAAAAPGGRGRWTDGRSTRTVFIYASLMKNGVVLGWANGYPEWGRYITAVYYSEGRTKTINGACGIHGCENAFCAAHVSTHDDKLLVFGGHNDYNNLQSFRMWDNPRSRLTLAGRNWPFRMATRRWYPTAVTLPNGRVLVMGGVTRSGRAEYGDDPQYNNPTYTVFNPRTMRFSRDKSDAAPQLRRTFPVNTYPHLIVMPDGGLVMSAGSTLVKYDIRKDTLRKAFDYQSRPHAPWSYPQTGVGLILPILPPWNTVRFMAAGGTSRDRANENTPASDAAHVINLSGGPRARWRSVGRMPYRRVMGDGIVLCDGTVGFFNGAERGYAGWRKERTRYTYNFGPGRGSYRCIAGFCSRASGYIYEPVIYYPERARWSRRGSLAKMRGRPRLYHSNAVLLPSCKVMISGSDVTGGTDAEIWSPPYLNLPRPTMGRVPSGLRPGAEINVPYTSRVRVNRALLVRTAAHTHSIGFDARALWLQVTGHSTTPDGGILRVRFPGSTNQIPPGMYMLTLLTTEGGPSNGAIISICRSC